MKPAAINSILLKLANTCNLNCTYCYWFKDKSVYEGNKIIRQNILDAFYRKLRDHIKTHRPKSFNVTLHGGEPLLAGKKMVEQILSELHYMQVELDTPIKVLIQTNGLLIDEEWVRILKAYNVNIGLSMDGPKDIQDAYRRDLGGKPTYERTVKVIRLLQEMKCNFGILSVCNATLPAKEICDFFINDLNINFFDFLIPDANHDSPEIPLIKDFYINLFKLWHSEYREKGVSIRIAKNMLQGMLGANITMQAIGYNAIRLAMIKPDGEIEAYDNFHSMGYGFTKNKLNILTNNINDIQNDEVWKEAYEGTLSLNSKCESCKHKMVCGGGNIATRWSKENRFDNPSVYCDQLYDIFEQVEQYVAEHELSMSDI